MPWALFLCGVHVWIAAGYSLDGPFWWKQKIIFWLAGYGSAPQNCLNAKAMEYHKFVYAGHQHANHQLWAAGICGLLRKSVGGLNLRSCSCSRACFFCILSTTAIKGKPLLYLSLQVRSHLLDPYQQHQRGIERFPQIREMMVALESEVQEYGGWGNIPCVQMDGKMQMQSSKMCSKQ